VLVWLAPAATTAPIPETDPAMTTTVNSLRSTLCSRPFTPRRQVEVCVPCHTDARLRRNVGNVNLSKVLAMSRLCLIAERETNLGEVQGQGVGVASGLALRRAWAPVSPA
jgi:hypothetical protein